MPIFVYRAKKENAETVTGEIVAPDQESAVDEVGRLGLIPVSVEEKSLQGGASPTVKGQPVKVKEMYSFTRQLVGLLKSGVPLLQALDLLSRQTHNRSFAAVLSDVASGVRNGRALSSCLADHPRVFSELYVAMARAGEESGRLKELLFNMAGYYKKQDEIAMKVRTALAYPIFMLVVGVLSVFFILTYVMPRITVLFQGLHALPWPTTFVIALSQVTAKSWPVLFVMTFILVVFFRSVDQALKFRRAVKRFLFGIPGIQGLVLKIDTERFARTLSLLLDSGIPILKALEIAIPILDNEEMKKSLWDAHAKVSGGMGFGETLEESAVVPDLFARLITVGEESGELAGALADIADTYDQEVSETTKALTTLLEPVMILVIGLVIGFIVFAMLMPIFQMDIFSR